MAKTNKRENKGKNVSASLLSAFSIKFYKTILKGFKFKDPYRFLNDINSIVTDAEFQQKNYSGIIDFIIDCTLEEWKEHGISRHDVIKSKKRGETVLCTRMAVFLVKKNIPEITDAELCNYFGGRNRQLATNSVRDFKAMNPKIKKHKEFMDKYTKISAKIDSNKKLFVTANQKK